MHIQLGMLSLCWSLLNLPQDNHVTLVSKRGQKYVCSLPTASEKKDSVKGFESSKLPNISALLHPLQKKPCLTKVWSLIFSLSLSFLLLFLPSPLSPFLLSSTYDLYYDSHFLQTIGWWTYEYCHGHFIRQYHLEGTHSLNKTKGLSSRSKFEQLCCSSAFFLHFS